ncbi:MAG: FecR family protein [Gammaproteobacteria bacterium]|nr:FecR family protein [Gammaproteobacteria bacterium]
MIISVYTNISKIIFIALILFPVACFGASGKVAFVIGLVDKIDSSGTTTKVTKKTTFAVSDTIVTRKNGQLMLVMTDNSKFTIRPDSIFRIDGYSYTENSKKDNSDYSLVAGGFRYITGKMGKNNKNSYKLKTAMGTIGIRGTDFETNVCQDNCGKDKGLYVKVINGGVSLNNSQGSLDVASGSFGHIKSNTASPASVNKLPDTMIISTQNPNSSDSKTQSEKQLSPEEQMVVIALNLSQQGQGQIQGQSENNLSQLKIETIQTLAGAGLPNSVILVTSNSMGIEPALVANALIDGGMDSKSIIGLSIKLFPEQTSNILTMGVATRAISTQQANQLGQQNGVSAEKLKSVVTTGTLLRPPELNSDKKKENNNADTSNSKENKTEKTERIKKIEPGKQQKERVNPQLIPKEENGGGPVPSPS